MKGNTVNKLTRAIGRIKFSAKKNSPELFLIFGIIGMAGTVVTACMATTKVKDVSEEIKDDIEEVRNDIEDGESTGKDLTIAYCKSGLKLARLYAPSIALGTFSIVCILSGHNIMKKRNVALGAAYAALERSYNLLDKRVRDRFGDEVANELKYGVDKNGDQIPEAANENDQTEGGRKRPSGVLASPYARFFDDTSRFFNKNDPEGNLMFIKGEERFANHKLVTRGYLFLNEVYERLGLPTTKAGQNVGWYYNPEHPELERDNYVDFGIMSSYSKEKSDFINGIEPVILLDFNVHPIIDKFETNQRYF